MTFSRLLVKCEAPPSPHYRQIATFPDHKHVGETVHESQPVSLKQVIEEIIEKIVSEYD